MGQTKVFLREPTERSLEEKRMSTLQRCAIRIQRAVSAYLISVWVYIISTNNYSVWVWVHGSLLGVMSMVTLQQEIMSISQHD